MGRKKKTDQAADQTLTEVKELTPAGTLVMSQDIFDTVHRAFEKNFAMLLVGDTGTGKTSLVKQEAEARGRTFTRINLNGQTDTADILGKWLIKNQQTVWQDGLMTKAVREGHTLLLDEVNACPAEVLFALHGLLEDHRYLVLNEKDGEIVPAHPDFRIFATMNPSDGYEGTRELNRAFLSRFKIVLTLDPTESEAHVLASQYEMDEGLASKLVQFAKETRATSKTGATDFFISTRDLINVAQLMQEGFALEHAMNLAIINKANPAEAPALRQLSELVLGLTIKDYETGETIHDLKLIKESYDKLTKENHENAELIAIHEYLLGHSLHDLLSEIQNGALLARKIIYRQSATTPARCSKVEVNTMTTARLGGVEVPTRVEIFGLEDNPIELDWTLDAKAYRGSIYQLHMTAGNIRNFNHQLLVGECGAEAWKKEIANTLKSLLAGSTPLNQLQDLTLHFLDYVLTNNPPVVSNTIESVQI